jgi:Na+/H+ antiporter NhaA
MKEFIMSSEILLYIWIVGRAYLGVGLTVSAFISYLSFTSEENMSFTLKEFLFTIVLHPIVVYYFIKEWNEYNGRN